MSVNRQRRMQTLDALLKGYGSLSVPQLLEPLAPEFRHHVLPESLGMPVRDKAAFAKHAAGIFGVFDEFALQPRTIIEDAAAGVVAVDARMLGTLKGGKGEWVSECVMMVRFTEDGQKVREVKEFVDSAKAMQMARENAPEDFGCKTSDSAGGGGFSDTLIHLGVVAAILLVCVGY